MSRSGGCTNLAAIAREGEHGVVRGVSGRPSALLNPEAGICGHVTGAVAVASARRSTNRMQHFRNGRAELSTVAGGAGLSHCRRIGRSR